MARSRKLEGVESRMGKDRIQRYRGVVWIGRRRERGPWTESLDDAIGWREATRTLARNKMLARDRVTVRTATEMWIEGITSGAIRNKSGKRYKPSVVGDYTRDIRICAELAGGGQQLSDIRLPDVQVMVDDLHNRKLSDARIRHIMFTFRALYNWALPRGYASVNPCLGLPLPAGEEKARDRIASPEEATKLLGVLQVPDRTAVALAVYAGLRAGEILALRWEDIDLDLGTVRIDWAIDTSLGIRIPPKSKAAHRNVPIQSRLEAVLLDHADTCGREPSPTNSTNLLFPGQRTRRGARDEDAEVFWSLSALHRRLKKRWAAAELEPLGMHEGRHTFASMLIAAGANPKAVQTYMGHSSITITFDRYGHMFPGHEAETLRLLDAINEETR